jgi:hypothetical protein
VAPTTTPVRDPAGHTAQTSLDAPSAALNRPVTQGAHTDDETARVAVLYVPAAHSVHAETPVNTWLNVPATQSRHSVAPVNVRVE